MRVLFFSKYGRKAAATRYRILQFLPYLEAHGVQCTVSELFDDDYLTRRFSRGRGGWRAVWRGYWRRMNALFTAHDFDLVVLHYEALPYMPAWLENRLGLGRIPYVCEYDDAIFHMYDQHPSRLVRKLLGGKIARLMRGARGVIVGNDYLADYARHANADVTIIPTVIDLTKYTPASSAVLEAIRESSSGSEDVRAITDTFDTINANAATKTPPMPPEGTNTAAAPNTAGSAAADTAGMGTATSGLSEKPREPIIIGWIGSPSTAPFVLEAKHALQQFCQTHNARLVMVGSGPFAIDGVPVEIHDWSESSEVREIQGFDVGIMPLPDEPWMRGKCGFKLIQYMGCGIPVIASPVGINRDIVRHGENGWLATDTGEWLVALERLVANTRLRREMGRLGREIATENFSLDVMAPRLLDALTRAAGKTPLRPTVAPSLTVVSQPADLAIGNAPTHADDAADGVTTASA